MEVKIKSIDDTYSVSSEGKFYKNGVEMKGNVNKGGYIRVCINNKRYYLHRLVAFAFPEICGEWFPGAVTDHISTVKTDNRAENLRFVSQLENCRNPLTKKHQSEWVRTEKYRKKMSEAKKGKPMAEETKRKLSVAAKNKPILQFTKEGEFIREWESACEVQRHLGYMRSNINACCLNKYKSAYGFLWKYKDNNK